MSLNLSLWHESRRKLIESGVRPVARVGRISAPAGASDRNK